MNKSGWQIHAITFMGTMLLTGLVSWMAFGRDAATKTELKEHDGQPAHTQQAVRNAVVDGRISAHDARLAALEKALEQMPAKFVQLLSQELDRRERQK